MRRSLDLVYTTGKEVYMVAIQLKGTIEQDGTLVLKLPVGVSPGVHEMVVVFPFDVQPKKTDYGNGADSTPMRFSAYPVGLVDNAFTFRREELYDDYP